VHIDFITIMAYAFGLFLLYLVGRIMIMPLKILLKLIYNAIIGGIVLLILNFIGGYVGIHLALNAVTALVVGFFGVPGIIMLLILKYILAV